MVNTVQNKKKVSWGRRLLIDIARNPVTYFIGFACMVYYFIFNYLPMGGMVIAFKNFRAAKGIFGSPWAEPWYKYFQQFFGGYYFGRLLRNTLILSVPGSDLRLPRPHPAGPAAQ